MSKVLASKTVLAMFALLVCAGMLQAQEPATPITATPNAVTVSYVVGTGPGTQAPVVLKSAATGGTPFFLDPTTMPFWLTVDNMTGTATAGGATINFNAAATGTNTLAAGEYTASVHVNASGYNYLTVTVTLVVSNPTATLSVTDGTGSLTSSGTLTATRNINWTPGTAIPTEALNVSSSDEPISYAVAVAVTSPTAPTWITSSASSGIAYNFGSAVNITFLADTLNNAAANLGSANPVPLVLTGTVTITPSGQTAQVITITITVQEPAAVATSLFPSQTPVQSGSGNLTVVVNGNYFGSTGGYTSATAVQISYGTYGPYSIADAVHVGGALSIASPTTLVLTIPYKDKAGHAILDTAQAVSLSVQNGAIGTAQPLTLTATTNPIIYTVTDAASVVDAGPTGTPTFAPYEIVTIFGDNFGPTAGTPVVGTLSADSQYPNSLTANADTLTVTFNDGSGNLIQNARLLFASNNQINALVPAAVAGQTQVQIVVTYNSNASTAFIANIAAANPGFFATGASGQGQGAILLANGTVNSDSNKVAPGATVMAYLSGMGAPDSTSANTASTKAAAFPASCIAATTGTTSYFATVNTNLTAGWLMPTSPATVGDDGIDGAVILGSQITAGHFAPCFATAKVTATVGGAAATVAYAGWVVGSVAGLYQVNVTIPSKATAGDLPIVITIVSGGKTFTTQGGVTVAVN